MSAPSGSAFYRGCYRLFAGLVRFLFRLRVKGAENEPAEGVYLVCANHASALDPVLISAAFRRRQVHFMAKAELFKWPLSVLLRALGAYPVSRGGGDVSAIRHTLQLLEQGHTVGIFPQGHRYAGVDPATTPVKSGAAMLAVRSGVPVIPVYLERKNHRNAFLRKTVVHIGQPIPVERFGYDPEASGEYNRIAGEIFAAVCAIGASDHA